MAHVQKLCSTIRSHIEVRNFKDAHKCAVEAITECQGWGDGNTQIQPYVEKGRGQVTLQMQNDMDAIRKLCKDSVSEVDFNNITVCMNNMNMVA